MLWAFFRYAGWMTNDILDLQTRIGEINESKGFHDLARAQAVGGPAPLYYISTKLLLVVDELGEAYDELELHEPEDIYEGDGGKPEGFVVELADAAIRLLDLTSEAGVPLAEAYIKHPRLDVSAGSSGYDGTSTRTAEYLFVITKELTGAQDARRAGLDPSSEEVTMHFLVALYGIEQLAEWAGPNLYEVIENKIGYNKTRPYKHGKAF